MKQAFNGLPVGISDHVIGDMVSIGAVARGANIIEKHFTLDKKMEGPDHILSMLPKEFSNMRERVRIVEKSLGDGIKQPSSSEVASVIRFRKTMYAKNDIKKGTVINENDIIYTFMLLLMEYMQNMRILFLERLLIKIFLRILQLHWDLIS